MADNPNAPFTPDEIAALNAAKPILPGKPDATTASNTTPFTPEEQAALTAQPTGERTAGDIASGYGNAVAGGLAEGGARTLGTVGDLVNLTSHATYGSLGWLLDKLGATDLAKGVRGLEHPIYYGTGQQMVDTTKALSKAIDDKNQFGLNYTPQTPGEEMTRKAVAGTTQGLTSAALAGGLGAAGEVAGLGSTSGIIPAELQTTLGTGALSGAGSVAGGQAGIEANQLLKKYTPFTGISDDTAETLGSLLGGFAAPASVSMLSREATPLQRLMEDKLGKSSPFVEDVGGGKTYTANRFGTTARTQANLDELNTALDRYAEQSLKAGMDPDFEGLGQTTQKLGQDIKNSANNAVDSMRQEISTAFDALGEAVPDTTTVKMTNTQDALGRATDRTVDPDIKAALQKAATDDPVLATLIQKPQLTWGDVNNVRQRVGELIQTADGSTVGAFKQVYGGLMDDMRTAAQQAGPRGLGLFNKANELAATNNDKIRGVIGTLADKELPESLPGYMLGQSKTGATRLESLFDSPAYTGAESPFQTPYTWSSDLGIGKADPRFGPTARSGTTLGATKTGNVSPTGQIEVKLTNAQGEPVSVLGDHDYPMGPQDGVPSSQPYRAKMGDTGPVPADELNQRLTDQIRSQQGLHYVDPNSLQATNAGAAFSHPGTSFLSPEGTMEMTSGQGELGRQLLLNSARGEGGAFDRMKLMNFWNNASPEARAALTQTPYFADVMDNLTQMHNALRGGSAGLVEKGGAGPSMFQDPVSAFPVATGMLGAAGHLIGTGGALSTAALGGLAEPLLMNLGARLEQNPAMVRMRTGTSPMPMNLPANVAGTGLGMAMENFPDTYQPDQTQNQPIPQNMQTFLSTADPKVVTAYVGRQLGPQVAAQLPAPDSPAYRGAIQNLMMQPQYRKALTSHAPAPGT